MSTYESLSGAEKRQVEDTLDLIRPMTAQIFRDAVAASVVVAAWDGGVSALIASLDAGEEIPNKSGLAGAQSITKENLIDNLMPYITDRAAFDTQTHLDNITPAAGAKNVITG